MKYLLIVLGLFIAVLTVHANINSDAELQDEINRNKLREAIIKALEDSVIDNEDEEHESDVIIDEANQEDNQDDDLDQALNKLFQEERLKDPLLLRIRLPRVRIPRIRIPRIRLPRIRLPRIPIPRIRIRGF